MSFYRLVKNLSSFIQKKNHSSCSGKLLADYKDEYVVFDLDGTLADITHRLHYIKDGNGYKRKDADWDSFHETCYLDKPKEKVIKLYKAMHDAGYKMVIVSGRSSTVKDKTERWLEKHGIDYYRLLMRPAHSRTADDVLKAEWLRHGKVAPIDKIVFCVDDRQRVVDMWRSHGLTCLQVEKWEE